MRIKVWFADFYRAFRKFVPAAPEYAYSYSVALLQGCCNNATSDRWKAEKHIKDEGTKSHDFVPPDLKN